MGAADRGSTVSLLNAYLWMGVWVCLSVSIILVNKQVMFYSGFHFPCTLAFWHMFLATVTARFAVWAWDLPDAISQQKSSSIYMQVAMIGLLFGGTLVAGNAALLYLSVPTIQMLKVGAVASLQQWRLDQYLPAPFELYDSHQAHVERM
jgi:hypothetical protein